MKNVICEKQEKCFLAAAATQAVRSKVAHTKTKFAELAFRKESSSAIRHLNRILKDGQDLTLCEAFQLAESIGVPLSHIILDAEGLIRSGETPDLKGILKEK